MIFRCGICGRQKSSPNEPCPDCIPGLKPSVTKTSLLAERDRLRTDLAKSEAEKGEMRDLLNDTVNWIEVVAFQVLEKETDKQGGRCIVEQVKLLAKPEATNGNN